MALQTRAINMTIGVLILMFAVACAYYTLKKDR
jgi:hypothetical protein